MKVKFNVNPFAVSKINVPLWRVRVNFLGYVFAFFCNEFHCLSSICILWKLVVA